MTAHDTRTADVWSAAVFAPVLIGLAASAVSTRLSGPADDVEQTLTGLWGTQLALTFVAHVIAARAAQLFIRRHLPDAILAQPVSAFFVLRVLAHAALSSTLWWPEARQPLVALSIALLDVAALSGALLLVAPLHGPLAREVRWWALAFACVRLAFATGPLWPSSSMLHAALTSALAHRSSALLVVGGVGFWLHRSGRCVGASA